MGDPWDRTSRPESAWTQIASSLRFVGVVTALEAFKVPFSAECTFHLFAPYSDDTSSNAESIDKMAASSALSFSSVASIKLRRCDADSNRS